VADLGIEDLMVEYSSGGYAIRPIDHLNLEAAAGSLVILLGPSGCGKTTLLSCLGGILSPTSGRITFGDVDVTALDPRALSLYRRSTVGIVFQAFNLVPSLNAIENVMVPMRAAGISRGTARQRAEELLTRVGLKDRMRHRPGDLSGGQQQRVAIARAIALDPPLILAATSAQTSEPCRSPARCSEQAGRGFSAMTPPRAKPVCVLCRCPASPSTSSLRDIKRRSSANRG
jgi:putative ABC transport system ATP-binding protein